MTDANAASFRSASCPSQKAHSGFRQETSRRDRPSRCGAARSARSGAHSSQPRRNHHCARVRHLLRLRGRYRPRCAAPRCPESGAPLASQSSISRFENAPTKKDAAHLAAAFVDQFAERVTPSHRDIFDIDAVNAVHGGQQLAFLNARHDERGFDPMHVYHAGSGLPAATILRPAKTPNGREVGTVLRRPGDAMC